MHITDVTSNVNKSLSKSIDNRDVVFICIYFKGSGYFAGPGKIAPRGYFAGPGKIRQNGL